MKNTSHQKEQTHHLNSQETHHTRAKPQSITWVCDVNTRSIKQMLKLPPTAKKDTTKSWASVCSVMPSLCQTETVPHWSHEEKPAIFQDLGDKNKCEYYSCEITRVQASSFPVEVSWRKIRTRPWRSRGSWALWRGLVSSHDWHAGPDSYCFWENISRVCVWS